MDLIGEEEFEEGEEREVTRLDLWARRGGGGSATRWGNIHRSQLAPNRMVPYVTSVISVPNPKIIHPPGSMMLKRLCINGADNAAQRCERVNSIQAGGS